MSDSFAKAGLDWEGRGYFGCPTPVSKTMPDPELPDDPWLLWQAVFHRAKSGDFRYTPRLLKAYQIEKDPIFELVSSTLIGDAGTNACFDAITDVIRSTTSFETKLDLCDALAVRGKLSDVPLLLAAFESVAELRDAEFIGRNISDILEAQPGPLFSPNEAQTTSKYASMVRSQLDRVVQEHGTDTVLVFKGQLFGTVRLAERMLNYLGESWIDSLWRRRFEASTGIDCTQFYSNAQLQPLAAAEILESFLESAAAAKYEDGVRYFFGHRIPD